MGLSVIEDISVFKHEYMDMSVPALVGQGEVGEVKLRERVASGNNRQIGLWFESRFPMRTSINYVSNISWILDSHFPCLYAIDSDQYTWNSLLTP